MTTTSAAAASRPAVPTAVEHVRTEADASRLAHHLQDAGRRWPVVVVSTPRDRGRPYVDAASVLDEVRGLAEVVVVHDGVASWAFSHGMPPGTQVYGGASRVYPVGLAWVHDLDRSHLWLAYDEARGARVREQLVQDALGAAASAGLAGTSAPPDAAEAAAGATVLGVLGTRALVQTDDGATLHVAEELTLPGVPLDRLLARGMRLRGTVDAGAGRLDVRGMLPDAAEQLRRVTAACPVGAVVPARVAGVADDAVTLELAPAVRVRVHRDRVTGNDLDLLGDLFSVGEVVLARVVEPTPVPGPGGPVLTPALRLDDVDDSYDAPLPAVRLLDGGPPWLDPPAVLAGEGAHHEPDDHEEASGREDDAPAPPARPGPARPTPAVLARRTPPPSGTSADSPVHPAAPPSRKGALTQLSLSLDEARARAAEAERELRNLRAAHRTLELEVAGLRDHAQELRARLDRREEQVEQLKTRVRKAEKAERALATRLAETGAAPGRRRLFSDPVEQLRHDVRVTWAETVPAQEKARYPLGAYEVGPEFCASLVDVGRGLEERVLRAIVMVVTDRAPGVPGYELHRLRSGDGGGDPYVVRETDGAVAWRLSLQVNAPQARRLHYWRLPGGGFELSRVVLHDDTDP